VVESFSDLNLDKVSELHGSPLLSTIGETQRFPDGS
jgi:hypothetical protein